MMSKRSSRVLRIHFHRTCLPRTCPEDFFGPVLSKYVSSSNWFPMLLLTDFQSFFELISDGSSHFKFTTRASAARGPRLTTHFDPLLRKAVSSSHWFPIVLLIDVQVFFEWMSETSSPSFPGVLPVHFHRICPRLSYAEFLLRSHARASSCLCRHTTPP